MGKDFRIRRLEAVGESEIAGLSDVLIDCVEAGASVSFMLPISRTTAETFWKGVAVSAAKGERVVLVAEDADGIVGTVQVIWAAPENQPHRADVSKMLVHRRGRRQGVGAALLTAIEAEARAAGRTLLVLDTITGGDAERLYARQGWQLCGRIPDYALMPEGGEPASTTMLFKSLD